MSPNIRFNHSNSIANDDLKLEYGTDGRIAVGVGTSIQLQLHNQGDETGPVTVHLYWCEPNLGTPAAFRRNIASELATPAVVPVPANADAGKSLMWTPTPNTLGAPTSTHGCLFAQAQVEPIAPAYDGEYDPNNWDPSFRLNAQQNLYLVNVARGTSAVEFALGVGHSQCATLNTKVRVDSESIDSGQMSALLQGMKFGAEPLTLGNCILATDATLVEGAECVVAPEQMLPNMPPIRLGNTGVISDNRADELAVDHPATSHTLTLSPGMLRQAIVDIPIPSAAELHDIVVAMVVHETRSRYVRKPPSTIGSAIIVVQVV